MEGPVAIRPLLGPDKEQWLEMWEAYVAFYRVNLDKDFHDALWERLFDPNVAVYGLAAEKEGRLVGFAHYVLHPHTWSLQDLCYLEDLYVREDARGGDVGHSLILFLTGLAKEKGWRRVYWHTETRNDRARRLYDRFGNADDFVRYTLHT